MTLQPRSLAVDPWGRTPETGLEEGHSGDIYQKHRETNDCSHTRETSDISLELSQAEAGPGPLSPNGLPGSTPGLSISDHAVRSERARSPVERGPE